MAPANVFPGPHHQELKGPLGKRRRRSAVLTGSRGRQRPLVWRKPHATEPRYQNAGLDRAGRRRRGNSTGDVADAQLDSLAKEDFFLSGGLSCSLTWID